MDLSDITKYVNSLLKESFTSFNPGFSRYPVYTKTFKDNTEEMYTLEIELDPIIILLYIKFNDILSLKINMYHNQPVYLNDILKEAEDIYYKIKPKTYNPEISGSYTCF